MCDYSCHSALKLDRSDMSKNGRIVIYATAGKWISMQRAVTYNIYNNTAQRCVCFFFFFFFFLAGADLKMLWCCTFQIKNKKYIIFYLRKPKPDTQIITLQ